MQQELTIALMPCGSLFEDFFDTIGVSFETLRNELTGGWMFNYIDALQLAGVQTVLVFVSARVSETLQFTHKPTGAKVCILPAPKLHRAFRHATRFAKFSKKAVFKSLDSYLILPLRQLASELKLHGCDAILFQDYENPSFDMSVLLGHLLGLSVFATFQGGSGQRSLFEYPLRPLALHACTGLIIATQTEIERVCSSYKVSPAKIARIFNPMDVTNWQAIDRIEARASLGISTEARVVVCHGRIDIAQKGLDILLDAWEQIICERPGQELQLLLVGTGSDADVLCQRIATMQLQSVLWVNEYVRDRMAIRRYLSAADVYTLPSRHEGFPVAPIEAMACGLPIVAANAPGVSDILEHGEASGGLIVPSEDKKALALALGRILDNEAWGRELGKRARQRVEERFSLEVIGKQLREFISNRALKSS